MTVSSAIVSTAPAPATIETRGSWIVCLTALGIAAVSFAAPAVTVVGLKSIAADLGGERSVPALAYSLAWLGASLGGIPIISAILGAAIVVLIVSFAMGRGRFGARSARRF